MKSTRSGGYVIISFAILLLLTQVYHSSGQYVSTESTISGYAYDARTRLPLHNTAVTIVHEHGIVAKLQTDSSGFFTCKVSGVVGWYRVYAFKDVEGSLGVDYVPAQWDVYVQEGADVSYVFNLLPGASIIVDGEIRFVESAKPITNYGFTVLTPDAPLSGPSIQAYGANELSVLGLNRSHIVVPAETRVGVKVWASGHEFTMGEDVGYFRLSQGGLMKIDIGVYCIQFGITHVKSLIDSTLALLIKAEDTGFLVTAEREDLSKTLTLLTASATSMKGQLFDEAFAALRQAYLLVSETASKLQGLFEAGSRSALVSTIFLAFTSIAIVYLMTEGGFNAELVFKEKRLTSFSLRPLILLGVYALLLTTFFLTFPGCRLIPLQSFALTAALSVAMSYLVVGLPGRFPEEKVEHGSIAFGSAVVAAFAVALRNLRRRKLRTTLTLTTVIILVFGLITSTSISTGRGLVTLGLGKSRIHTDALLIRDPDPTLIGSFVPLPTTLITRLESKPNVTLVAAKAENLPRGVNNPLGLLRSPYASYSFLGVLGIEPTKEAEITLINNTVVEGSYLRDDEHEGILISASLVKVLNVKVGDVVYFLDQKFRVTGFFNDRALEELRDADGGSLMPQFIPPMQLRTQPCMGNQIVVMTYKRALTLPTVVTSRVSVQTTSPEDLLNLAQIVASTFEYSVWTSVGGKVQVQYVGQYFEEKGMTLTFVLMLIVMLIVGTTVFGAVEERRNELAILSSIGLNPTHIATIFLAEAAVTGFIGGGLGYLMGTAGYRVMGSLIGPLAVREKVSADWALMALLFSITATLLGALIPALKASTVVTPSLQRKWKLDKSEESVGYGRPLVMELPVKIRAREVDLFFDYMVMRFLNTAQCRDVEDLRGERGVDAAEKRLRFAYFDVAGRGPLTKSELIVTRRPGEKYLEARLAIALQEGVVFHDAATYVRKVIFEWNALTFRVATFIEPLSQVYTLINYYTPKVVYIATTQKDVADKLSILEDRLAQEGIRIPRILIFHVNPLDMEDCFKKAEEMVRESNVVCLTGKSTAPCIALAIVALEQKRMMCYVMDPRSPEDQATDPFKMLNVMSVHPKTQA